MCGFCDQALHSVEECSTLIEIPLYLSGPNFEFNFGKVTCELNYDSDDKKMRLFQWFEVGTDFWEEGKINIHFCPICGENFDRLLKEKTND